MERLYLSSDLCDILPRYFHLCCLASFHTPSHCFVMVVFWYCRSANVCTVFNNIYAKAEVVCLQFYKRCTIKSPTCFHGTYGEQNRAYHLQIVHREIAGAQNLTFMCTCTAVNYQLLETMTGKCGFYTLGW